MFDVREKLEEREHLVREPRRFEKPPFSMQQARARRNMLEDVRERLTALMAQNPDMPESTRARYNQIYNILQVQIAAEHRLCMEGYQ